MIVNSDLGSVVKEVCSLAKKTGNEMECSCVGTTGCKDIL